MENLAGTAGGIASVKYDSALNISQTKFFGNKALTGYVLDVRINTTVFVNNSEILQNRRVSCEAVVMESVCNFVMRFAMSQDFVGSDNSTLIFRNSLFKGNRGIHGSMMFFDSIGYLENCTLIRKQKQNVGTIAIDSELRLSNTILEMTVQDIEQDGENIKSYTQLPTLKNRLYTYKCKMKHGNLMLNLNTTNFKQNAMQEDFLDDSATVIKET